MTLRIKIGHILVSNIAGLNFEISTRVTICIQKLQKNTHSLEIVWINFVDSKTEHPRCIYISPKKHSAKS